MVWVILIALAAFVVGLIGGWAVAFGRARASRAASTAPAASMVATGTGGTADDEVDVEVSGADTPPSSVPDAVEVSGHRLDPASPSPGGAGATDRRRAPDAAGSDAQRDERRRYAEIIGIETENASLRAVAARVPALERRIRELEALAEVSVESAGEPVIDLTGPTPAVRDDEADRATR